MATQFEVTLYIHPTKGPIMPLTLNLLEIETAVTSARMGVGNIEEARMRVVCQRIKDTFPRVIPESNRYALATILARFSNAQSQFNGIALRLDGEIEAAQDAGTDTVSDDLKKINLQVDALGKEVQRQKRLLEIEQQEHRATKGQVASLQGEKVRLMQDRDRIADKNKATIEDLQARLRQRETENQRLRDAADKAVRENAQLRVQMDLLTETQQEVRTASAALQKDLTEARTRLRSNEDELGRLRVERASAKKVEDGLRQRVKELEEELTDLETAADAQPHQAAPGSDQFNTMLP